MDFMRKLGEGVGLLTKTPEESEIQELVYCIRQEVDFPELSELRIRRFLDAENWNITVATNRVRNHADWVKSRPTVPDNVEAILKTDRIRYLGLNKDGNPVVCLDSMWGKLCDVDGGVDAMVEATSVFYQRLIKQVSEETGGQEPQNIMISIGGPPDMEYSNKCVAILAENYPEMSKTTVIYPIPWMVRSVVWFMVQWLPERMRNKIALCSKPEDLCETVGVDDDFLPYAVMHPAAPTQADQDAAMAAGGQGSVEEQKKAAQARGEEFVEWDGVYRGEEA